MQMPSSLEHLQTFSERPHMSTEQRKGAERACCGAGCECVERCGSAGRAKQRVALIKKSSEESGSVSSICTRQHRNHLLCQIFFRKTYTFPVLVRPNCIRFMVFSMPVAEIAREKSPVSM